jgi:FkbM family methyltransferase
LGVDIYDIVMASGRRLPDFRGKGRLALIAWRHAPHTGEFEFPMRMGHRLSGPRTSHTTWLASLTGRYDDPMISEAIKHVTRRTLVLDVGGCFGFWTVPLGVAAAKRGGRVIVFEPVPANQAVLRHNVAQNHLEDFVELRAYALGSENKKVTMEIEEGVGNATICEPELARDVTVTVDVRRLDDEDLNEPCSFMKLDVEGYEMEVLEGAERFIERTRPIIFGEFNVGSLSRRTDRTELDVAAWAGLHNYRLEGLTTRRPPIGAERLERGDPAGAAEMIALIPN